MNQTQKGEGTTQQGWDIYEALNTPATENEKHPPRDMSYDQPRVPISTTISDSQFGVVKYIETEMGFSSKSQSAQRLLRVGLEAIDSEKLDRINRYIDVVNKFVPYVGEAKFAFGNLREDMDLSVNFGRDTKNRQENFSVFWTQKEAIRDLTGKLGISTSDVFQWGLVNTTVVLGQEGLIPQSEAKSAENVLEDIEKDLDNRLRFSKDAAMLSIHRAYEAENHEDISAYCHHNVPELWRDFIQETYSNHQTLDEQEFLYGMNY